MFNPAPQWAPSRCPLMAQVGGASILTPVSMVTETGGGQFCKQLADF